MISSRTIYIAYELYLANDKILEYFQFECFQFIIHLFCLSKEQML